MANLYDALRATAVRLALGCTLGLFGAAWALAQTPAPPPVAPPAVAPPLLEKTPAEPAKNPISFSAVFSDNNDPVKSGLHWRIFSDRGEDSHDLVDQSTDPAPVLALPDGDYVAHAAFGLASAIQRFTVSGQPENVQLVLRAGALRVGGTISDQPIASDRLSIAIYVPEPGNSEAKRVVDNASPSEIILLPEGTYHIVSTYLDTVGVGSLGQKDAASNASNSVVTADIKVQPGKLTDTTLRHRAAVLTLKLVNGPNGESLTDTTFTVLTPGGDVIRELIGAFPSLVLAEGEYAVIARHLGKTYQSNFKVQSGLDRDIEILAQ